MIELLVATAITLIGMTVIAQVFLNYEGWRRTTVGAAQTQEAGMLGAFTIERDLRNAGYGMIGTGCAVINANNELATPSTSITMSGMPATITQNSPTSGTDKINMLYSTSAFGNIAATIQSDMPSSSSILNVDNGVGFLEGDLIIISQPPKDCTVVQLTKDGQAIGKANVTTSGSSWDLQHNPVSPWNPPGGQNIFPSGGYSTGAKILNLGTFIDHTYYVQNNMLRVDERSTTTGMIISYDLIPGVMGMRARYGRDTSNDGVLDVFDNDTAAMIAAGGVTLTAVQFSLIVRSGNWERDEVSPASLEYWPGGPTLSLSGDDRHYRYRVFQSIVPLKNVIWNN